MWFWAVGLETRLLLLAEIFNKAELSNNKKNFEFWRSFAFIGPFQQTRTSTPLHLSVSLLAIRVLKGGHTGVIPRQTTGKKLDVSKNASNFLYHLSNLNDDWWRLLLAILTIFGPFLTESWFSYFHHFWLNFVYFLA